MALPHKEWRAYLDTILDVYMRTNVTVDAVGYMVDRMEEIFSEYLVTVPEYSSKSIYPLNADPLLALSDFRFATAIIAPGDAGVEEKWLVKREVMNYIKGVIELSSLKVKKVGGESRTLATATCWISDEHIGQPMYMEPAVLTRAAKAETPLQPKAAVLNDGNIGRHNAANSLTRPMSFNRPNDKPNPPLSQKRGIFLPPFMMLDLFPVPVQQEILSEVDAEKFVAPKLSIPRPVMPEVWNCIKATPFSSGIAALNHSRMKTDIAMLYIKDEDTPPKVGLTGRLSPPLFPRWAGAAQSNEPGRYVSGPHGMEFLKEIMQSAVAGVETQTREREDLIENMRIAEGWPSIPLDLGPSFTPPMTIDGSKRTGEEESDDDNTLQIDELMLPSSPPLDNRELKELFRNRMDEILLPRKDCLLYLRGPPNAIASSQRAKEGLECTFTTTIRETLQLPLLQKPAQSPADHSAVGVTTIHNPDVEVERILDEVCEPIEGLDPYSAIIKDRIEEKDGMFLPVPSLPPPCQGLVPVELPDFSHLSKPFDVLPLDDTLGKLDVGDKYPGSVPLVQPAIGITRLKLELSWQPFVYRGPLISHETLCDIHSSPFPTSQQCWNDVEEMKHATNLQRAKHLIEGLPKGQNAGVKRHSRMVWDDHNDGVRGEIPLKGVSLDGWSGGEALLLTRVERQRSKGTLPATPETHCQTSAGDSANLFEEARQPHLETTGNLEDMSVHEDYLPLEDEPGYHRDEAPSSYILGETEPRHSKQDVSAVGVGGLRVVESGSSHGHESAFSTNKMPTQTRLAHSNDEVEGMMQLVEDGMVLEPADASLYSFEFTQFNHEDPEDCHQPDISEASYRPTASNISLLQDFLAHRAVTSYQHTRHHFNGLPAQQGDNKTLEDTFGVEVETNVVETDGLTLPADHLSQVILLPQQWRIPQTRHRYLASLPFLQRRALVQLLEENCSVDLCEVDVPLDAELIIDPHTAVKFITVSELVPANFEALASSIMGLGYGFSRIVILLEAYPFSRSISARKLERTQWEQLKMITETVISTFMKLRRTLGIGMGMLEGAYEHGVVEDLGHVQLEFLLSYSVEETARVVRCVGDYAESAVDERERQYLWGRRPWLDIPDIREVLNLSGCRGMNVFAALAIASVMSLGTFVGLPLSEKLECFGGLVGNARMKLFEQHTYKEGSS